MNVPLPLALSPTPAGARDIETTAKGIAILARGPHPITDPFVTPILSAVLVRWHELRRLELLDPWPCFRLSWRSRGARGDDTFGPYAHEAPHAFASAVERLVEAASAHAPSLVRRGWLDVPDVSWEATEGLPEPFVADAAPALGAFRTAARDTPTPETTIVARRHAPPTFEALLVWLRSSPARPSVLLPREAVICGDGMLHVRWRDGRCGRIPLDALRLRLNVPLQDEHADDAVYVFGRATRLLLVGRSRCDVAQALDRHLARGNAAPTAPWSP